MIKTKLMFACLAVLLSIPFSTAMAGISANSTPLKGRGDGQITSAVPSPDGVAITAAGTGYSTHLGKFERTENLLLNPETGQFTGTLVFTAANGDELWCSVIGGFTSQTTAAGTYTITGGTGRFETATGTAEFGVIQSDPVNFSFEFAGTLDKN